MASEAAQTGTMATGKSYSDQLPHDHAYAPDIALSVEHDNCSSFYVRCDLHICAYSAAYVAYPLDGAGPLRILIR